jgi:3-oxoacyl-[acyl-carrier protein] reductase
MDNFVGKVALVTGAGRGAGREIALALSSLGIFVAANDINPINLDETVHHILNMGGNAKAYLFDVAKRMPVEGMVTQVLEDFGHIDILVNRASVAPDDAILEMDEWEFHRTLDVNLGGPFFCMQQVGRAMREQGGGVVINIISTTGKGRARKGCAVHTASQAALLGLTHAAADELCTFNIRVNAILACRVETGQIFDNRWDTSQYLQWLKSSSHINVEAYPKLVRLVLFLCSSAASSLTGQVISAEFGESMP